MGVFMTRLFSMTRIIDVLPIMFVADITEKTALYVDSLLTIVCSSLKDYRVCNALIEHSLETATRVVGKRRRVDPGILISE